MLAGKACLHRGPAEASTCLVVLPQVGQDQGFPMGSLECGTGGQLCRQLPLCLGLGGVAAVQQGGKVGCGTGKRK